MLRSTAKSRKRYSIGTMSMMSRTAEDSARIGRGQRNRVAIGVHLMYNCPNWNGSDVTGATRALYTKTCDEVAWNVDSHKYLCRRTSEGQPVQMLVDTGCEMTMVSAKLVDSARVDPRRKVPVMCTHGDTMLYPTAMVKLQSGP